MFLEDPICHERCACRLLAVPAVAHAYRCGSPLTSYWMAWHKHDPVRVIGEAEEGRGPEAMICRTMSFCATEKRELVPFSLSKC